MKHVADIELIDLAGGVLDDPRRGAVEAHISACPRCRRHLADHRQVRQLLGDWQVPASGQDLWPSIRARLGPARDQLLRVRTWRRLVRAGARAAAVILLAAGVGHLAGRLTARQSLPAGAVPTVAAKADRAAVAESLHLGIFGQLSPAGMAESLLPLERAVGQEASK